MEHTLPHRHDGDREEALAAALQKQENFEKVAGLFRLLADPSRVRIFWLLCHCETCVLNLSAMVNMSSPAVSHHLRLLRDAALVTTRRRGKEVYYRAADTPAAELLHKMIEGTTASACPEDAAAVAAVPHTLDARAETGEERVPAEQLEIIRRVHDTLAEDLGQRITIEELSRRFLMNTSTLKALFREVYGNSIAAHIKEHRMEKAASLLRESGAPVAEIGAAVGYESAGKFAVEFKKFFGVSPSEYRKGQK